MSQQSKPAAYFKAAAKALRLQRTLSRSKSSKSKDLTASATMSAPCSPATPTFQHSNGRRLSYSQYIQHPQGAYSIQLHTPHHHQHIPDLHYDTPLYSLQRRRNNSRSTSRQRSCSPSSRPAAVDSTMYSKGITSSKLSRRSGPPVSFPVITIHHMQPDHTNSNGTYVTLTRSKSMPLRRRKRFSHQPPTAPMPSIAPAVSHSQWSTTSPAPAPTQHSQHRSLGDMSQAKPDTALVQGTGLFELAAGTRPDTGGLEQLVLGLDLCVPGPPVSDSQSRSSFSTTTATILNPVPVGSAAPVPGIGHTTICRSGSGQNISIASVMARPSRSLTGSSLISSKSNQSMPLADSSMSIQSHLSEASMLSAAMSASGLPSMDVMMDQVDRSIAADRQAQLVENAHVSVPHVAYVNRSMLAEACSAKVETWVN